jgi:hypothetical protein
MSQHFLFVYSYDYLQENGFEVQKHFGFSRITNELQTLKEDFYVFQLLPTRLLEIQPVMPFLLLHYLLFQSLLLLTIPPSWHLPTFLHLQLKAKELIC